MPDIPQAAVAAAAAAISDEYRSNDGNPRERFSRDLAILAIEAAAPHIASAAERATGNDEHHVRMADFWDRIIGFRAGGRVYHPSDVEIVMKSPEESR